MKGIEETNKKLSELIKGSCEIIRQVTRQKRKFIIMAGFLLYSLATQGQIISEIGQEVNVIFEGNGYINNQNVAMDSEGNVIVVLDWQFENDATAIYMQRFDKDGSASGAYLRESENDEFIGASQIAMSGNGDFVVTWMEYGTEMNVLAQRFSADGVAKGDAFKVNPEPLGSESKAYVAMDDTGNFVVTWNNIEPFGPGPPGTIYAQRYNAAGMTQGDPFQVTDAIEGFGGELNISMNSSGDFIISWISNSTVYAQQFDATGIKTGSEIQVSNAVETGVSAFDLANNVNNHFVVTWLEGFFNEETEVFEERIIAARYNAAGEKLGEAFIPLDTEINLNLRVAMVEDGNFIIVWESAIDYTAGSDIYAQGFNAEGIASSDPFMINNFNEGYQQLPAVAVNESGSFVIAWNSSAENEPRGIFAQRHLLETLPFSIETPADQEVNIGESLSFTMAFTNEGENELMFSLDDASLERGMTINPQTGAFSWTPGDIEIGHLDVTVRLSDGKFRDEKTFRIVVNTQYINVKSEEFRVNTTTDGSHWYPDIAVNMNGDFVIAWVGFRYSEFGPGEAIFAQRFKASGQKSGDEIQIKPWAEEEIISPVVAMDNNGDFVVSWLEAGDNNFSVYAQRFDANGYAKEEAFIITNKSLGFFSEPTIAMDGEGSFVISWRESNSNIYSTFVQRFDALGQAKEEPFMVSDLVASSSMPAAVAMDDDGGFTIAWAQSSDNHSSLYVRQFDHLGQAKEEALLVSNFMGSSSVSSIALDSDGGFVIAWDQYLNESAAAYARRYDASGQPKEEAFRVDGLIENSHFSPVVAMESDRDFVITWAEQVPGPDIFTPSHILNSQRYSASGQKLGESVRFHYPTYDGLAWNQFATGIGPGGKYVITWTNVEGGFGEPTSNIYARNFEFNKPPIISPIGNQNIEEGSRLSFTVSAADPNANDQLVYSLDQASIELGMRINASSGAFEWIPTTEQSGSYQVTVTLTDNVFTLSETFTIIVTDLPEAPVLTGIGDQSIEENTELSFTVSATDPNAADELVFSLDQSSIDLGMRINANSGVFSWTPVTGQSGSYQVTITVTDGALSDSETIEISVNPKLITSVTQRKLSTFKIYPNPVKAEMTIAKSPNQNALFYKIFDMSGNLVSEHTIKNDDKLTISVEDLPEGIYLLHLIGQNWEATGKFLKEE